MDFFCFSVIPQPVYMNSEELEKLRQQKAASEEKNDEPPDDDLKTPTIEELTFPGHHRVVKIFQQLKLSASRILQEFRCHLLL